jgi:lysozyme family protein
MVNYKNLVPFIKIKEGGISGTPKDSASKNPSPCGKDRQGFPYHTNKGVQWATFKLLASKGGYTASCENFLKMPDDIWNRIYKVGFWDEIQGDRIQNQAIANTFVEMVWGSGIGSVSRGTGAVGWLNGFFKKNYNQNLTTITQMVDFVNKLDSEGKTPELFEKLNVFRANKYRALNQPTFTQGWLNRLNSFYVLNKPYALSKKEKQVSTGLGGVVTILLIVYLYNRYGKRN